MKFRHQINILQTLILAACLMWSYSVVAGGKPVRVTAANPNSALQGEELDVVIDGSGFNQGSTVEFLVTDTEDSSQIVVDQGSVAPNGKGTRLTVSIAVNGDALDLDYDIRVTSNGRRGKGTTLFRVKKVNDEEISTNPTTAHWTFDSGEFPNTSPNTILELTTARGCSHGGGSPLQMEHGEYGCDHDGEVHYNLTGGQRVGKKGDQAWCENFKAHTLQNTQYNYVWNGDCTTGNCWFQLFNWSYGTHVITEPTNLPEPVGLLWIEFFAQLPAGYVPTPQPNPYVDSLALDVYEVLVIYKALGKNRTMVKCKFEPQEGEVVFYSDPVIP